MRQVFMRMPHRYVRHSHTRRTNLHELFRFMASWVWISFGSMALLEMFAPPGEGFRAATPCPSCGHNLEAGTAGRCPARGVEIGASASVDKSPPPTDSSAPRDAR